MDTQVTMAVYRPTLLRQYKIGLASQYNNMMSMHLGLCLTHDYCALTLQQKENVIYYANIPEYTTYDQYAMHS